MKVLIIDDNPVTIDAFDRGLRRLPHVKEVCFVRDVESARQMLGTRADAGTGIEPGWPWDMVVMNSVPGNLEIAELMTNLPKETQPRLVVCIGESGQANAKILAMLWSKAYIRAVATPISTSSTDKQGLRLAWLPCMLPAPKLEPGVPTKRGNNFRHPYLKGGPIEMNNPYQAALEYAEELDDLDDVLKGAKS
jgi:hypothetical protein